MGQNCDRKKYCEGLGVVIIGYKKTYLNLLGLASRRLCGPRRGFILAPLYLIYSFIHFTGLQLHQNVIT